MCVSQGKNRKCFTPLYLLKRRHHLCDRLAFLVPASLDDFAGHHDFEAGEDFLSEFFLDLGNAVPFERLHHAMISYINDPSAHSSLLVTGRPRNFRPRNGSSYSASS